MVHPPQQPFQQNNAEASWTGGLRLREGRLDLRVPPLPKDTTSLVLRGLHYHGSKLVLVITVSAIQRFSV